jgi:serine/threonine protein kinase
MTDGPNKRFSEPKSAEYIYQVCQSLKYLHSKNVIHRDIKPENLLNCMGTIKLSDFGWSTHTTPDMTRNTFCGTLDYLPPEMVKKQTYDKSVDIWSIGVLAFEFMTGSPPFESESHDMTTERIKGLKMQYPDFLSAEAVDFIGFILKIEPYDRPSLDEILNHPWICKRTQYKV